MAKIGRPTDEPAGYQFRVRLTETDKKKLSECSERLNINKSEVIRKGIDLVHKASSK